MTIGERIKQKRKENNLTQKELGEKLGVSNTMIAAWELGNRTPKAATVRRIAKALNCNESDLINMGHSSRYFETERQEVLKELQQLAELMDRADDMSDEEKQDLLDRDYQLSHRLAFLEAAEESFLNADRLENEEISPDRIRRLFDEIESLIKSEPDICMLPEGFIGDINAYDLNWKLEEYERTMSIYISKQLSRTGYIGIKIAADISKTIADNPALKLDEQTEKRLQDIRVQIKEHENKED